MNKRKLQDAAVDDGAPVNGAFLRDLAKKVRLERLQELLVDACVKAAQNGELKVEVLRNATGDYADLFYSEQDALKEHFEDAGILTTFRNQTDPNDCFDECGDQLCGDCEHCIVEFNWRKEFVRAAAPPVKKTATEAKMKK